MSGGYRSLGEAVGEVEPRPLGLVELDPCSGADFD